MRVSLLPNFIATSRSSGTPVRVNFVIDRLSRAGTESQLLALICHLDRRRVLPSLCLLDGSECRELWPDDCPVVDLGLKRLIGPKAILAAGKLAAFWRSHRVDIVQTYFLDSTYFAAPLVRLCGIRRVVRVRNNAGYWLTSRHRLLGRLVGRLGLTLTNSEAGRQAVVAAERLSPRRTQVIENGVDVERFAANRAPDTSSGCVRIGCVANLRPVKNIDGLIRAVAAIYRTDPRLQLLIAGEGEQRSELQQLIRAHGLEHVVRLLGTVPDVPRFLTGIDIAINCSHSESMSNAVLEYMAAGRAIVATDVGANARLIHHEREGLIVPPHDNAELVSAIARLLHEPRFAGACARAARRRVESEFSRASMVRRFEEFFTAIGK